MPSLANKHRGGISNLAGNVFEAHFGVWRVITALLADARGTTVELSLQLKNAAVDDWVERQKTTRAHFSLKRTRRPSWSDVRGDFIQQRAMHAKGRLKLAWVVGSAAQATRLRRHKSAEPDVDVMAFPPALKPDRVVESVLVSRALKALCVKPQPTSSDLLFIWRTIDSGWQSARKPGKFVNARRVTALLLDQAFPPIRLAWRSTARWRAAEKRLAAVPGFSFRLEDGHLFYDDGAGTTGLWSCKTTTFKRFVSAVLTQRPTTLEQLRELL